RGAMVHDGTGAPGRLADVSVKDGRIVAVDPADASAGGGARPGRAGQGAAAARETVDADGLALMPGIVDNHTHYDAQVTWDPCCTPSPALGVTTAVIGNCGFTIAPCRPGDRELIMRNLTQVE